MSRYWDILEKVRDLLVSNGPLAASGSFPAVPSEQVVFAKLPKGRTAVEQFKRVYPGPKFVVGFSGEVNSPPTEGGNCWDVILYPVVVMYVERDVGEYFEEDRVKLLLDRMEGVRQLFHMGNLAAGVGQVTLGWAGQHSVFKDYQEVFDYASFTIPMVFKSYEGRNAAGTA
jgi:hypothetical protein